jgi:hypothetical protein
MVGRLFLVHRMEYPDTSFFEARDYSQLDAPWAARPERRRPLALLSLPNTGSDWLAGLFLEQNPGLNYFREFFNPICNPKYENALNRAFGCEMVDSYQMIAKPHGPYEEVYQQTWAREEYTFTKENYSAFNLRWFHEKFDCLVPYRRVERTLPGRRLQVKTWYDALYGSLIKNKWGLERDVRVLVDFAAATADTIAKRQVAAFVIHYYKLLKDAHRYNIPVLDYEMLMQSSPEELVPLLTGLPGVVDAERLAQDLCASRRPCRKNFSELRVDDFFARLTDLARECGGECVAGLSPHPDKEAMLTSP